MQRLARSERRIRYPSLLSQLRAKSRSFDFASRDEAAGGEVRTTVWWSSTSGHLHGFRVPLDDLTLRNTFVAEESGTGGTEAEGCVLDRLFARCGRS